MEKYMVKWNKGKAHLAEQGSRRTFCGETFYFKSGWTRDQDATLSEFVKDIHPPCRACAQNAKVGLFLEKFRIEEKQ